jgi:hypothetical protein
MMSNVKFGMFSLERCTVIWQLIDSPNLQLQSVQVLLPKQVLMTRADPVMKVGNNYFTTTKGVICG